MVCGMTNSVLENQKMVTGLPQLLRNRCVRVLEVLLMVLAQQKEKSVSNQNKVATIWVNVNDFLHRALNIT